MSYDRIDESEEYIKKISEEEIHEFCQKNNIDESTLNQEPQLIKEEILTKKEYLKAVDSLYSYPCETFLQFLTIKESIIAILRFGYVDRKEFSVEAIADFMQIDKQEVIKASQKYLDYRKKEMEEISSRRK